jgi:adenosylcobinamide-phosphate synthase
VFGVLAWFIVFGAAGALAYRGAVVARSAWSRPGDAEAGAFGRFAADAFAWMDWLPLRLTAASFAVVGDFEDALYCWRTQAMTWADRAHGIVLAAGAGALGVRLGGMVHRHGSADLRPDIGLGSEADADAMAGAVGMLWRALLLWLALLALVTVARWFS